MCNCTTAPCGYEHYHRGGEGGGSRSGRAARAAAPRAHRLCSQPGCCEAHLRICNAPWAVSYTHLTLPTICSV
eukprot:15464354-Alexandrium_andersonii.AAC.1